MTHSSEHNSGPPVEPTPPDAPGARADELNDQRLRLTAARDWIDHAVQLLSHGGDGGKARACEELRHARRALDEDQSEGD